MRKLKSSVVQYLGPTFYKHFEIFAYKETIFRSQAHHISMQFPFEFPISPTVATVSGYF